MGSCRWEVRGTIPGYLHIVDNWSFLLKNFYYIYLFKVGKVHLPWHTIMWPQRTTCRSQLVLSGGFWRVKAQWQAPWHDEPSCQPSVHYFFDILLYVYGGCFAVCMPVHRVWCLWRHHIREHRISRNWSYMWMLGIEPGSLEKHLVFLVLSQLSVPITLLIIVFKGKLGKWFTKILRKHF